MCDPYGPDPDDTWPACQLCPGIPYSPAEYVTEGLDNLCARCCQESGSEVLWWIGDPSGI